MGANILGIRTNQPQVGIDDALSWRTGEVITDLHAARVRDLGEIDPGIPRAII